MTLIFHNERLQRLRLIPLSGGTMSICLYFLGINLAESLFSLML